MVKIIFYILLIFLVSCSSAIKHQSVKNIVPRRAYLFVKKIVNIKVCEESQCAQSRMISVGSGFIVKINYKGAYALTAAHVCEEPDITLRGENTKVKNNIIIKVETLDDRYYTAKIIATNNKIDACILFIKDLVDNIEEVKIALEAPVAGDRVYNVASPYGIKLTNVVPIFEGFYIGTKKFRSYYTFTAAPGSSGSMILNTNGELIGLLHSVYVHIYEIVVGVTYYDLKQFIAVNIREYDSRLNLRNHSPPVFKNTFLERKYF